MTITQTLEAHGLTQSDLATGIPMAESTLSQKLSGKRRWRVDEANRVLAFLRRLDPGLTLDQLFGEKPKRRSRKVAA